MADGELPDDHGLLSEASPTLAHRILKAMVDVGLVGHIVSTNMDGLFVRCGVPMEKLSELHGSCFREYCVDCNRQYWRPFDTLTTREARWTHLTCRVCDSCGGDLRDSIVHFTEPWTFEEEMRRGLLACYNAKLALVVGTSMLVQPSCAFPRKAEKMVLVNLQRTPVDDRCEEKVYCESDMFFQLLAKHFPNLKIGT